MSVGLRLGLDNGERGMLIISMRTLSAVHLCTVCLQSICILFSFGREEIMSVGGGYLGGCAPEHLCVRVF